MSDESILSTWQNLLEKNEKDLRDDSTQLFLFNSFLAEDLDAAWKVIPEHQEIRKRYNELLSNANDVPAPCLQLNIKTDVSQKQIQNWVLDFLAFVLRMHEKALEDAPDDEEVLEVIQLLSGVKQVSPESDVTDLDEHDQSDSFDFAITESLADLMDLESDVDLILYEHFTQMTKVDTISWYLLEPRIVNYGLVQEGDFSSIFKLNMCGIFDYCLKLKQNGVVSYTIEQ